MVFDVGANDGSTTINLIKAFPWITVFAFEPTPFLVTIIRERTAGIKGYHLQVNAVGEVPGEATFNVAGSADWGCSSLLEFSDGLEKTWPGRTDLKVTDKIKVDVIRLDDFLTQHRIDQIDFLHVDTQGHDLSVLKSLGSRIGVVKAGVIEVPQSDEVKLYKGQHTKEEALRFLESHGFKIWRIDHQLNEDNVFFRRKK